MDLGAPFLGTAISDPVSKWYGSGFLNQQSEDGRSCKLLKTTNDCLNQQKKNNDNSNVVNNCNDNGNDATLLTADDDQHRHQYQQVLSFSSGSYTSGANLNFNGGGRVMHWEGGGGGRGQLTVSQWMELEHQALIYKYLTSNLPVPHNLLIPIKRALESAALPSFSPAGFLTPTSYGYGWGPFNLSNSSDPEPGRCRRTDGKKWRCSRDAVTDGKYCERHMNRGRHRSRKPVESAKAPAPASTPTNIVSPHHQDHLASSATGRVLMNTKNAGDHRAEQMLSLSSMLPATTNSTTSPFLISKQHNPYPDSTEFGLVSSDSLLNPSHDSAQDHHLGHHQHHSLLQFIDNSPDHRTQLSISTPIQPHSVVDFMSSTSSPNDDKVNNISPLRLLPINELDPIQMGLGVVANETYQRESNSVPVASMGGPLGEVLQSSNNADNIVGGRGDQCRSNVGSSDQNLMNGGWNDSSSISTCSSSSADNNYRRNSLFNGLLGGASTMAVLHSSSLPAL
ncbi:Growth-regulating factor 6 [Linum perenne]